MLQCVDMINYNVEDLVRKYVNFRHGVASHGWNTVYCEVCGDGSRTKGPRGGWLFTDGGNTAFYHCFNQGCEGNFSLNREHAFSKDMRKIFDSFGIPSTEYTGLLFSKSRDGGKTKPATQSIITHKYLDIPDYFILLADTNTEEAKLVKKFLREHYALTPKDYSFYISTGLTASTVTTIKNEAKKLIGRLIIPYFKNGKMIYYQARDVTNTSKLKYTSPDIQKNTILFNIDQLYRATDEPLFVTEGAQDAIHVNGVATIGNEISTVQTQLLASSKRRKILIPDFHGDSNKLCDQFIDNGWDISIPNYRVNHKDLSSAVVQYGKLYAAYDIMNNIKTAQEAKLIVPYMNRR